MRTNQDRPICFKCREVIENSPIFAAPCGHERCKSAVWHGICLMEFWEEQERADKFEVVGVLVRRWAEEHTENEEKP
jgi:hypothetical protein